VPEAESQTARRPLGRPRLYEPDVERDRLLAAALEVLRRNNGEEASLAAILEEAGLSTRAFYRHFETKEEVICALYERDARSFGASIRRRVEAASGADEALSVWVNELLGLAYDRRRAERMSTLSSPMVAKVVKGSPTERLGVEELVEPLREVLAEGLRTQVFPQCDPNLDSSVIYAFTSEVVSWVTSGSIGQTRRESVALILRYCRPALGGSSAPN
jgi:AcrR family transcriptional regulator